MGQQKNASPFIIAIALIAMSSPAFAQGKKAKSEAAPAPAPIETKAVKADDKVDISDLESKYWAPKDTDFSVVQNRTYSKDNRFMIARCSAR